MKKSIFSQILISSLGSLLAISLWNGCGKSNHDHGHDHGGDEDHAPPHGGTPVLVAEDKFHLELVADPTTGQFLAYVLDGHLEEYVPVKEDGFELVANTGQAPPRTLAFKRVPDSGAAGASAASSRFAAEADWVKSVGTFDGHIPSITLNGTTFTNITFPYPKGTKHVH